MQSENTGSGFGNFSGELIRDCKSLSSGYVPGYATYGSSCIDDKGKNCEYSILKIALQIEYFNEDEKGRKKSY